MDEDSCAKKFLEIDGNTAHSLDVPNFHHVQVKVKVSRPYFAEVSLHGS